MGNGKIISQRILDLSAPVSDEPIMSGAGAVGVLVFSDNIDGHTDITTMANTGGSTLRIMPNPAPPLTSSGPDLTKNQLITGRGGVGKALRMFWTGNDQDSSKFQTWPEGQSFGLNKTHYMQYWFRVTMSQLGSTNPYVKFLETWFGDGSSRTQCNTRNRFNGSFQTNDHHDPVFELLMANIELVTGGDSDSQQPIGPYPVDLFDGNWHRHTQAVKSHTSSGVKDGFQREWFDGVKVADLSQAAVGLIPPNGVKPYCTQNEVDRIPINIEWGHYLWGGPQTSPDSNFGPISWTMDVDDILWRVG